MAGNIDKDAVTAAAGAALAAGLLGDKGRAAAAAMGVGGQAAGGHGLGEKTGLVGAGAETVGKAIVGKKEERGQKKEKKKKKEKRESSKEKKKKKKGKKSRSRSRSSSSSSSDSDS